MDDNDIIADLIERRHKLGITQKHLAALSGVSLIAIKKIESRVKSPTINTLIKLTNVLGLEIKLEVKKIQL